MATIPIAAHMEKLETDSELFTDVRKIIDEFQCEFIEHLEPLHHQTTRSRLLRLYEVWQQIHIRRLVDLADSANKHFNKQRLVPGCILTRALIESVAIQYYAYKKIVEHTNNNDPEPIHKLLIICVFGSRDKSSSETAIQVLTAIDHLDKEFKIFREVYDHLSEYAHPNLKGGFGSYVEQKELLETNFGINPAGLEMQNWGLGELHLVLLIALEIHNRFFAFHPSFHKMANQYAPDIPL